MLESLPICGTGHRFFDEELDYDRDLYVSVSDAACPKLSLGQMEMKLSAFLSHKESDGSRITYECRVDSGMIEAK
jgi:hypothetical protein